MLTTAATTAQHHCVSLQPAKAVLQASLDEKRRVAGMSTEAKFRDFVRLLKMQLAESQRAHDDMRSAFKRQQSELDCTKAQLQDQGNRSQVGQRHSHHHPLHCSYGLCPIGWLNQCSGIAGCCVSQTRPCYCMY